MTGVYTLLALTAFAANSILCRLALGAGTIDAASFTTIRLVSGAAMLAAILRLRQARATGDRQRDERPGIQAVSISVLPALALFSYAVTFSFAYLSLTTGTGALILFGAVQTTMLVAALRSGERPRLLEWLGLASAITGLIVLVLPGLTAPPLVGSALMATAGVSWGFYSLWGRGSKDPLAATTTNFVLSMPLAVLTSVVAIAVFRSVTASVRGIGLAASSGALASGLGYVIWYAALRGLSATRAATVQLAVPVIAAIGGVVFLSETISVRLAVATALILGGISLAVISRR